MNLAFKEKHYIFDEYTFEFNQGGDLGIRLSNGSPRTFTITLKNGKFLDAKHNLGEPISWGRSEWIAISAIGQKIIELESK